jgi:hypothetical protein
MRVELWNLVRVGGSTLKRQWHGIRGGGEEEIVLAVRGHIHVDCGKAQMCNPLGSQLVTLWGYNTPPLAVVPVTHTIKQKHMDTSENK